MSCTCIYKSTLLVEMMSKKESCQTTNKEISKFFGLKINEDKNKANSFRQEPNSLP